MAFTTGDTICNAYPYSLEDAALILAQSTPAKLERELRTELSGLGLEWKSLKGMLPDWADTAFDSKSGVLELKTFLSRNAGLEVNDSGHLANRNLPAACFKTTVGTALDQVIAARGVATACARLVAKATTETWKGMPENPADFRAEVLRMTDKSWVDLPALLEACWKLGVPVLYLPNLPVQGRKMEGMVTFVASRPVIILTKRVPHPDWLLFVLAHELGHIAKGHLPEHDGEAIVDDTVDVDGGGRDQQEDEANRYSTHVLAPRGKEVRLGQPLPKAPELATIATAYAHANGMSPGYVILNAVHNSLVGGKKPYGLGQAALKALAVEHSAADACRIALEKHINVDVLRDDSIEYLEKLSLL